MSSTYRIGDYPKFIWAVDEERESRVYEAKLNRGTNEYHGYELGDSEKAMRTLVAAEWNDRCPVP